MQKRSVFIVLYPSVNNILSKVGALQMLKIKGKAAVDLSKGLKLGNALKQHGSRLMIQILLLQILMKVPFINKAWQKVEQHLHVSKAFMPISKGIFILFLLMVARLREGKFGDMNVRVKRVVN
jgi:hypothetical protein